MTVNELIEELKKFDGDFPVMWNNNQIGLEDEEWVEIDMVSPFYTKDTPFPFVELC